MQIFDAQIRNFFWPDKHIIKQIADQQHIFIVEGKEIENPGSVRTGNIIFPNSLTGGILFSPRADNAPKSGGRIYRKVPGIDEPTAKGAQPPKIVVTSGKRDAPVVNQPIEEGTEDIGSKFGDKRYFGRFLAHPTVEDVYVGIITVFSVFPQKVSSLEFIQGATIGLDNFTPWRRGGVIRSEDERSRRRRRNGSISSRRNRDARAPTRAESGIDLETKVQAIPAAERFGGQSFDCNLNKFANTTKAIFVVVVTKFDIPMLIFPKDGRSIFTREVLRHFFLFRTLIRARKKRFSVDFGTNL